jgi:uncharacterized protein (TIGR02271 family)
MSRTVTALFDSRPEAEAAKARLASSNIDADNVRIIDKSSSGFSGTSGSEPQGFWASLKEMFIPEEDRFAYGEGISRGGYLLCAQVDEDQADQAVSILDETDSVDFDQRQQDWRSEGWQGYQAGAGTFGAAGTGITSSGTAGGSFQGERSNIVEEEHIPIVEEELRVGKREVTRGGARVRSYVREIPVHEQVSLREEHVSVERRPVDQTLNAGDFDQADMLRERNIEMTETAEEAVVAKEARVREEMVVRKTAEERTETIDDTVRRTEVEVEEGAAGSQDRSAFGSFGQGGGQSRGLSESRTDADRTDFAGSDRDKSF